MDIFNSLAVPKAYIAKHFILSLDQGIVRILSHQELLLLKKTFDLIQSNLALHMPSHDIDVLVWPNSSHVQASHRRSLHLLIGQSLNLLLRVIK